MTDAVTSPKRLPFARYSCGYAVHSDCWEIALYWQPVPVAERRLGEGVYRHGVMLRVLFRCWFKRY